MSRCTTTSELIDWTTTTEWTHGARWPWGKAAMPTAQVTLHLPADLWIVPLGTKCFEDPSLLDEADRYRALSIEGVAEVDPILISFAQWRMPDGGSSPVLVA